MRLKNKIFLALSLFLLILIVGAFLLVKNANLIVKYKVEQAIGEGFSVEAIDIRWRSIEATNVLFKNPDGLPVFKVDKVSLSTDLIGVLKREYNISSLSLKNPYLLIEIDEGGKYRNPFMRREKGAGAGLSPIPIGKLVVHGGSLAYSDRKGSRRPIVTKVRDVELELNDIAIPLADRLSSFVFDAKIPGDFSAGAVRGKGKVNLKTTDLDCDVSIKNLDITGFKPYFQKEGDADITRGFFDLEMKAHIGAGKIRAPGKATLRGLAFRTEGRLRDRFLGVPRTAVLNFLKDSNDEITVEFTIEGDLKNPKFNIRESFIEKLTIGLAERLGLSITRIGETIIVEGARQIEKGLKGIGEEIQKIFK